MYLLLITLGLLGAVSFIFESESESESESDDDDTQIGNQEDRHTALSEHQNDENIDISIVEEPSTRIDDESAIDATVGARIFSDANFALTDNDHDLIRENVEGAATLEGSAGNDTLVFGDSDVAFGDEGEDLFVVQSSGASIIDFQPIQDSIEVLIDHASVGEVNSVADLNGILQDIEVLEEDGTYKLLFRNSEFLSISADDNFFIGVRDGLLQSSSALSSGNEIASTDKGVSVWLALS